jgi:hypothetical protein
MARLLFSVTRKDFIRQTFRSGGKGGQNQNKVESGVRLIHPPSEARGEARDSRDQHTNERNAFLRLVDSPKFKAWHRLECARRLGQTIPETPKQILARVDLAISQGVQDGSIQIEEYDPLLPL